MLSLIIAFALGLGLADLAASNSKPLAAAKDVQRGSVKALETEGTLIVDKTRYVDASGEVGGAKFALIPQKILALTNMAADAPKKPIYIFLNGPGGSVFSAVMVSGAIRVAKKRGFEVKCITSVLAASATFNMLAECSTRYALPSASLLFHPVRVMLGGGGMSGGGAMLKAVEAKNLAESLDKIDSAEIQMLCDTMVDSQVKCEKVKEHYNAETLWNAGDLKEFAVPGWLHLVDDIQGIDNLFNLGE